MSTIHDQQIGAAAMNHGIAPLTAVIRNGGYSSDDPVRIVSEATAYRKSPYGERRQPARMAAFRSFGLARLPQYG